MLSELQRKNIGDVFDTLDHDHDGVIEQEDFKAIAADLSGSIGLVPDSEHQQAITERLLAWWEQVRLGADGDQDGRVNRAEYLAAVDIGLLSDPAYLGAVTAVADALFAAAGDGDGTLSRDKVVRLYRGAGLADPIAVGAFEQIDTDGDGRISLDEWRQAVHGAFTSTGAETIGSNMLGNAPG
ncbi:EF-hand domain-containing protein [Amycolatopsis anabasis]|uniref:EF-hand domain-containing protein n=1 Tax=Amycolatopsis anabasis TaxID=1840409 RepID=UPI00131D2ED6|nr:EF-hand domain-containing protein [Amycolatopsis anabasis]